MTIQDNFTQKDRKYMTMALELASKGDEDVLTNPRVGCIIVKNDKVIGKGYHQKFGQPHAEINALENCKKNNQNPKDATAYITLEPCSHTGKTPPCTQALIKAKIAKVITAVKDPNKLVAGKGLNELKNAGIHVNTGLCSTEAKLLNAPFFKFHQTARPWVILKWAQSLDGFMARKTSKPHTVYLSNEKSRQDVHKIRRASQGILVGVNTVKSDNPMLNPRPDHGKNPWRIVLDSNLTIPLDCKLLNSPQFKTLIVTTLNTLSEKDYIAQEIMDEQADILAVAASRKRCDLGITLDELGKKNIQQLLVEAGPTLATTFITSGLADQIRVYTAPILLKSEGTAPVTKEMAEFTDPQKLHFAREMNFDNDTCLTGLIKPIIP